jgi:DNA polymerase-3 subunit epsilon
LLDIETTGLSINKDQAIQVAFGRVKDGRTMLRGYYTLKPTCPIKPRTIEVHGMTEEMLAYSPTFADIADELKAILDDRAIMLGWGAAKFDVPILRRQFAEAAGVEEADWQPRTLDLLPWDRLLRPDVKHNLQRAAEAWGVPPGVPHDAWHDCRLTWGVFCHMAYKYPEQFGNLDVEDVFKGAS